MTFENHTRGEHDHGALKDQENKDVNKDIKPETESSTPNPLGSIDLAGGQPRNDQGGVDMSQYTGPNSKASSQLVDPESPYRTGAGNGLADQKKTEEADWENPEPENDSF